MKINTIKIQNFKGISDLRHDFTHPVTVVTGPVGIGKTSFIEAVRYGLTGELPLTPIQSGKKQAVVEMVCSSPEGSIDIFRDVTPPNKKSVRIMGRKVTGSSSETFLEETTNVSGAILKLATASDVLAELKPDAFGNLFLNESMEKKTLSDLITILNDNTSKEKATLYTNLSLDPTDALPVIVLDELKKLFKKSELSMEVIQKAHEEASTKRKEINAKYKLETSRTKKFTEMEKPEYDTFALRRKYEEFLVVEKNAAAYSKSLKAYQTALEKKKEQDKKIAALEFEIALKKIEKPDASEKESLSTTRKKAETDILSNEKVLSTLKNNKKWFETTLEKLGKPICPISDKLICKTDKTAIKDELNTTLADISVSCSVTEDKIKEAKNRKLEAENKLKEYDAKMDRWRKFESMKAELKALQDNPVILPEKPASIESIKFDYSDEKKEIQDKLNYVRDYENLRTEYLAMQKTKTDFLLMDYIVKALDPKGPVIAEFIKTFVGCLEEACNERAALLNPGFSVKLVPENGLKVLFSLKKGKPYLLYQNLSAGEKLFACLILTDLINSFYDSRILILDNTDHLDKESFEKLISFVTQPEMKDLYDTILISCVTHDDIVSVAEKNPEIEVLRVGEKVTM